MVKVGYPTSFLPKIFLIESFLRIVKELFSKNFLQVVDKRRIK